MGGIAWSEEEDELLRQCIERYGEGKWHRVPLLAGLNRCRKSCRLRWLNYLRPNIKRGNFTEDEVDQIIKLHKLLGNRWSLIASRLSGRTANDVKNYWNCHLSKRLNNNSNAHQVKKQIMTREVQEQPQNHAKITDPSKGSNLEKSSTWSLLPIQYTGDGEGQLVHNNEDSSYSRIEEGSFFGDLAAMDFDYFNGVRLTFGYDNINQWNDFIL